jgi:MFS family permease
MTGKFSSKEKRSIAGLSIVIGLRMLGLSMIIPVFSVYAVELPGSSVLLAGIAFGIYGLTQAFLQIPFGYMSDRFGRKPVVAFGLLLFGIGSVICAVTTNIYILIAGRFMQGGGAIASACFAWIADLTQESRRNTAMAFMGISIGGGIVLGMIFGPVIGGITGAASLFWVAAGLSMVALYVTVWKLDEPENNQRANQPDFAMNPIAAIKMAADPDLMRLNVTGFLVNACMISTFFVIPLRIAEVFTMSELWKIYLPLAIFGGFAMMLSSRKADKGSAQGVIVGALICLAIGYAIMYVGDVRWTLSGFAIFFAAFSVLEATLPAAVSKLADPTRKGAIIGVYNMSQFFGTFAGGTLAGALTKTMESEIFIILAVASIIAAVTMSSAKKLTPAVSTAS